MTLPDCRIFAAAAAATLFASPLSAQEAPDYDCVVGKAPVELPVLMVDAYLSDNRDSHPEFLAARTQLKALVMECEAALSIGKERHKSFLDYTLSRLMIPEVASRLQGEGVDLRKIDREFDLYHDGNWPMGESPDFDSKLSDVLRPFEGDRDRHEVVGELVAIYIAGHVKGREALKGLQ